ncbi:MAG: molybdopterin-dependent oxidoreductase [Nitriliruptorales bacterium]|nr:molybdopterin-dependent oxidoreductase [Nitriliruptorales bacterium]
MTATETAALEASWEENACILCENNCGVLLEIVPATNGERPRIGRIRGDKEHPNSQGYTCNKARELDRYQTGPHRLTRPLRRLPDGTFEEADWDTAIREVAAGFARLRDEHGGETIFYYGGGGQGNHLPGAYAGATRGVLGSRFASNALAQEKTGEFWVDGQLFGNEHCHTTGDWEHCEVAVFVGKNPWQTHGVHRARTVLRAIANDPDRSMVVIDPRRTETAELADFHLQVRPGGDAHLLAAMLAIAVTEDLLDDDFVRAHTENLDPLLGAVRQLDISAYCARAGVDEELVRAATHRIATASSAAFYEDLGIQQNIHSTLNSWLEKSLWLLTGNLGRGMLLHTAFQPLWSNHSSRRTPVTDTAMLAGIVPCNVITEEILTDHPNRFRGMLVEANNPVHSLADSHRMREAFEALEFLVVIDVAMSETARLADWVLPASSQFEKAEATFFTSEHPANAFHLRHAVLPRLGDTLPEAEIHRRLVRQLDGYTDEDIAPLLAAAATVDLDQPREGDADGLDAFALSFLGWASESPLRTRIAPVVLYEVLGPRLPDNLREGAVVFALAHQVAMRYPPEVANAGFVGDAPKAGNALFRAILDRRSGTVFAVDSPDADPTARIIRDSGKVNFEIPVLLDELATLADDLDPGRDPDWPLVLAAGERRAFTANTIFRDPDWRKRDREGAIRIHPTDADALGIADGADVRLVTRAGQAEGVAMFDEGQARGMVSLPNGMGVDFPDGNGRTITGVAPNELTSHDERDPVAGTPHHKHVKARLEPV